MLIGLSLIHIYNKMQAVIFDVGRVLVHWAPQIIEDALCQICTASPSQIRAARQAVHHEFSTGALGAPEYHRYLINTCLLYTSTITCGPSGPATGGATQLVATKATRPKSIA